MTDNKRAADDAEREAIFRRIHNERGWMDLQDIFNAGWDEALSSRADGGKGEAALQRLTEEQERLGLYDDAPQAECAPREAQPNWKALHAAADAVAASADIWAGFSTQDAKVCVDAYLAAPTPERAQPVGPRTTLNYDGTFDTTCAHCGGNGCFACLKSAAPTPERADAAPNPSDKKEPVARYPHAAIGAALISSGIYDRMNDITGGDREARMLIQELIEKVDPVLDRWHATVVAAATPERADAEKDAALLEALRKIAAIENKMYGGDWDEIEEARSIASIAILAANKEPK